MRAPSIQACGCLTTPGQPCQHQRARKAEADQRRPTARQRGYTADWERAARAFLQQPENRFCVCGCGRSADLVDHIKAHRGDQSLFWDRANWQPMATRCHATRKQSLERRRPRGVSEPLAVGDRTGGGQPRDIFPNFLSLEKGQKP